MSCTVSDTQCAPLWVGGFGYAYDVYIVDCNTNTAIDLTNADVTDIVFIKPSGIELRVEATVIDPLTGYIQYIFQEGDLDEAGYWTAYAIIEIPGTLNSPTTSWEFFVDEK